MGPTFYSWSKPFKSFSNSNSNTESATESDSESSSESGSDSGSCLSPDQEISEMVCNNICGNLLLNDQVSKLEIWRKSIEPEATVTISVFNSARNSAAIQVIVIRTVGNPVNFTVPPGNTISATIDDAESIRVARIGLGLTEGKFCLDVCYPVFSDDNN